MTAGEEPEPSSRIGWPALGLLMVASVGSIAQLSDSASFGFGAVTVYLVPAILFLLPVGLVSAELATSHPGGIFVWVRTAFGDALGFQAAWFAFMFGVTLFPSLLSFGAAALAISLERRHLVENGAYMGAVVLIVFWLATVVVSRGLRSSSRVSNIGLVVGTIVPAGALVVCMVVWLTEGRGSLIDFSPQDALPPFDGLSSLALVVGTFIGYAGMEVNAVHVDHMRGRLRNYLRAVLLATVIVFTTYLLGSLAISVIVPDAVLELTSGASQAFSLYAHGFGIPILSNILSGMLVIGALAAAIAWSAGPSRSMWFVGRAGFLPPGLQETNSRGVQTPLLVLQGAIVSVLALVFVVMPSTSEAFAILQDISIALYMMMYVCMFAAAIRLRRRSPDVERPIRIPGLQVLCALGMVAAIAAIVLSLTPPSGYSSIPTPVHAAAVVSGVVLLSIPPLVIRRFRKPDWASAPEPDVSEPSR